MKVKVILYGIGALGKRISQTVLKKKGFEVVGAVDIAPDLLGRDLGEVLGLTQNLGILVETAEEALGKAMADVVIHSTSSHLSAVCDQIVQCVESSLNVVSTCEELSYPYWKHPELAKTLDTKAQRHGVTVLGTGINPGFLMDTLPILLTAPCIEVHSIRIRRRMYSGNRRTSYQRKIGTGLSMEAFNELIQAGKISGHVGLEESIAMIAAALNWHLDDIVVLPPTPVLTEERVVTTYTTIQPKQVCGLTSIAHGIRERKNRIILEFISHATIKQSYDSIIIKGVPNITQRITRGVHGDLGTIGILLNVTPTVINASPGLTTMKELPLPSYKETYTKA